MHSFLKAVGFSKVTKREEMKEIILDVIKNYDEKNVVGDHPDGVFAQFSGFMEMTAVLLYVVSMMMTTDFMWNIIILFSEELELQLRNR